MFVNIFIKINEEIKIFNTLKENNVKEIHCFNNFWINITRNIFGIEIHFFEKDNKIQKCDVSIDNLDKKISCNNFFYNKNHPCNFTLINILKYK